MWHGQCFVSLPAMPGTGKTTAIRKFSHGLDINCYQVLYISDSALTPRNFLLETLHALGYQPRFYRVMLNVISRRHWQY